jgi:uncharacterized protein YlxW (UPF0749 family)
MDMNYEMGRREAQNDALVNQLEKLTEKVSALAKDVEEMKATVNTWKSSAAGAVAVLSVIGVALVWLGDGLVQMLRVKLGF